ncbi:alpha/beta fold hydrolase [Kitasatospora sp. NPDC093558]|uniref:S9 family peptidase n=1 Tax=Kitasatospora sp. NPDC093558 TaxID=3155201 RepID=UPI0034469E70
MTRPVDLTSPEPAGWRRRFAGGRPHLPRYAALAPDRCVLLTAESGKPEVMAWDQGSGSRRQVTDQPGGTGRYAIDPTGRWVWWFADPQRIGRGRWWREPFEGGAAERIGPDGRPAGLALGGGRFAVGSFGDGRTRILTGGESGADVGRGTELDFAGDRQVEQLSADGAMLSVTDVGAGGPLRPDLRVLDPVSGEVLADWPLGEQGVARPLGFSPHPGDERLLVLSEERDGHRLLLWDCRAGTVLEVQHGLTGELRAQWTLDGSGLVVCRSWQGRDELYELPLDGAPRRIPHDPGEIRAATARPDGVDYLWSSSERSPRVRSTRHGTLYGGDLPDGAPARDIWADGPGGPVHALLSAPPVDHDGPVPPTLFLLHGGPATYDADAYDPYVSAWVDHGYQVVRTNYRGSTGYGRAWREAAGGDVGHTELADLMAVRAHLAANGSIDDTRVIVGGSSWGGYLALLALGVHPDRWRAGFAIAPVADFAAAYEDETERLRALDRALFGGTPSDVPERYHRASPITWAAAVRAPVLLMAGARDPRCPPAQIEAYARAVEQGGGRVELHRYDGGHEERRLADLLDRISIQIEFSFRYCAPGFRNCARGR